MPTFQGMARSSDKNNGNGGKAAGNGGNGNPIAKQSPDAAGPRGHVVLPPPQPKFDGVIGTTYKDSTMGRFPVAKAPDGAPNVLLIVIDDCGFGQWSTFGGQIPTPNLDRLAKKGLRYTRFHTTALCSPSRAALLTGRNHHSCATGVITEIGDSFPGYTGQIPKSCAMGAEMLRQNGYSTAFFGKNHNVADWETSVSGPFDRWPTSQGFDHFYGFVGGESNQWQPALYEDTRAVEMEIPPGREDDYTLNEALADRAIEYIHQQKSVTPDRPFFVYYAPGATHAPHHVPKEWIEKFKGQFDQGWDKYREECFKRQLALGVIPKDTKLTPRPEEIPAYDALTPDQKKVAARLMETFAAYTAQTDHEVGRLLDTLEEIGQADNTLVFWLIGDNGASMEGGPHGAFNEMVTLTGMEEDPATLVAELDAIGGPRAYNHYPVGWAWAMNTPFQWGKQIASHFGGTRNPLVVSWPERIKNVGGLRTQFHHIIDIVPTILEVARIPEPVSVNGVAQRPIEGVSIAYTFDDAAAPGTRRTQYFEMLGNRAIYHDGWVAACFHGRLPWKGGTVDFDDDTWALYNIEDDFSEYADLSAKEPLKLKQLQDLFMAEAGKYNVLPLDDRAAERLDPRLRPSLIEGRTAFTYFAGTSRVTESCAPNIKNRSHTITAHVDIPADGGDGVLVAEGGIVGGFTLYVKDRKPVYEYNYFTAEHTKVVGSAPLPVGPCTIRMEFTYDGGGFGRGGAVKLLVNGTQVGSGHVDKTEPARFSADETFDVGCDTGSPVSNDYRSPFRFTGKLKKIEIQLEEQKLTPAEHAEVMKMHAAAEQARH
jgi:arylsulfatase